MYICAHDERSTRYVADYDHYRYVCVCTYIDIYICTYIDTYAYVRIYTCMCLKKLAYVHTHTHTYIHTYAEQSSAPLKRVQRRRSLHTYIYTYIHTYTHTYIYTYMHTYICRTKFRTLEESPKKEKLADQIRDTEQKLKAASEKYHTMNERLSVCPY